MTWHRSDPRRLRSAALAVLTVLGLGAGPSPATEPLSEDFARADRPRAFRFPEDHGAHPDYRTEWWYLTGALRTPDGRIHGLQATWFRNALAAEKPQRESTLAARDLILFHGGWTDVARETFRSSHRVSRAAPGWAGAREGILDVHLFDDRLVRTADGRWILEVGIDGIRVELELRPTREALLHGEIPGWSRKGPDPAESSYYASQTRLAATGRFRVGDEGPWTAVEGSLWFDHEVFSQQLSGDQVGWDWFAVALDDGTDLMAFRLRESDGSNAPTSSGTVRRPDGSRRHLAREEVEIDVTATWSSPAADPGDPPYPSGWRIEVPSEDLELRVEPLVADQEHRSPGAGSPIYWEGLCSFTGTREGRPVHGLGYVELVGYRAPRPAGM